METITFDDIALLFVATINLSMILGGLSFWVIMAIKDGKGDD